MHDTIAYLPYGLKVFQKLHPIDIQFELAPSFGFAEKAIVVSECEIGRTGNNFSVTCL